MPLREPIPDIRSLDLLRSVSEFGSIRAAAKVHGISQPAASTRLRSLEQVLGVHLLDRSSGRARLTLEGMAVVQWSESIISGVRDLLTVVHAARSEERTHLRIVASMTVAEYLVPEWLNHLARIEPDLAVSLQMGNSERVLEVIGLDGADIGFIEGAVTPRTFASQIVRSDDLVFVVAPEHALARRKRPLGPSELADLPLVMRERGSGTREVLENELLNIGLQVEPIVELGSTTAIKAAIKSGVGPGVLSRLAVSSDLSEGSLVEVEVKGLELHRSIRAVWPLGKEVSIPARRLLEVIQISP